MGGICMGETAYDRNTNCPCRRLSRLSREFWFYNWDVEFEVSLRSGWVIRSGHMVMTTGQGARERAAQRAALTQG